MEAGRKSDGKKERPQRNLLQECFFIIKVDLPDVNLPSGGEAKQKSCIVRTMMVKYLGNQ